MEVSLDDIGPGSNILITTGTPYLFPRDFDGLVLFPSLGYDPRHCRPSLEQSVNRTTIHATALRDRTFLVFLPMTRRAELNRDLDFVKTFVEIIYFLCSLYHRDIRVSGFLFLDQDLQRWSSNNGAPIQWESFRILHELCGISLLTLLLFWVRPSGADWSALQAGKWNVRDLRDCLISSETLNKQMLKMALRDRLYPTGPPAARPSSTSWDQRKLQQDPMPTRSGLFGFGSPSPGFTLIQSSAGGDGQNRYRREMPIMTSGLATTAAARLYKQTEQDRVVERTAQRSTIILKIQSEMMVQDMRLKESHAGQRLFNILQTSIESLERSLSAARIAQQRENAGSLSYALDHMNESRTKYDELMRIMNSPATQLSRIWKPDRYGPAKYTAARSLSAQPKITLSGLQVSEQVPMSEIRQASPTPSRGSVYSGELWEDREHRHMDRPRALEGAERLENNTQREERGPPNRCPQTPESMVHRQRMQALLDMGDRLLASEQHENRDHRLLRT